MADATVYLIRRAALFLSVCALSTWLCGSAIAGPDAFALAAKGDADAVARLLTDDPGLTRAHDAAGATMLHHAAASGSASVVRLLLGRGADPNAPKPDGVTPLHVAVALGKIDAAKALLAAGADPDAKDGRGRTPRALAQRSGKRDLVAAFSKPSRMPSESTSGAEAAWLRSRIGVVRFHVVEAPLPEQSEGWRYWITDAGEAYICSERGARSNLYRVSGSGQVSSVALPAGTALWAMNRKGERLLSCTEAGGAISLLLQSDKAAPQVLFTLPAAGAQLKTAQINGERLVAVTTKAGSRTSMVVWSPGAHPKEVPATEGDFGVTAISETGIVVGWLGDAAGFSWTQARGFRSFGKVPGIANFGPDSVDDQGICRGLAQATDGRDSYWLVPCSYNAILNVVGDHARPQGWYKSANRHGDAVGQVMAEMGEPGGPFLQCGGASRVILTTRMIDRVSTPPSDAVAISNRGDILAISEKLVQKPGEKYSTKMPDRIYLLTPVL